MMERPKQSPPPCLSGAPRIKSKKVGEYELKHTLGEGAWGKVKLAIHSKTKQRFAIKIIEKENVRKQNMGVQIKREVNIMKQIKDKNPHVVQLYEVLASKTKIYLVLELVTGGELFDKLVRENRFSESKARYYFRQLISSVELCHKLGVCHRDLKPENLLLDAQNNLKVSDFGLSALYEGTDDVNLSKSCRMDLLHTTCGTPNYVSPEVLKDDGYDGRKADIWSMGVILFVMVTGTLPFDEPSLPKLFERIQRADFSSPSYLSSRVVDLISKILVPDPTNRISIKDIKKHPWYEHIFDKDADEMASNAVVHADETPVTTLNISSSGDIHDVLNTIMTALRELSFAAITSDEHKIKGYKKSRRGMIGLTVNVSKGKNNEFLVAIRKGRGDALEYSEYLKRLVTKLEQGRGVNVYRPPPRSQDK